MNFEVYRHGEKWRFTVTKIGNIYRETLGKSTKLPGKRAKNFAEAKRIITDYIMVQRLRRKIIDIF